VKEYMSCVCGTLLHFGTWPWCNITLIYYFTNLYVVYSPLEGDELLCPTHISTVRSMFKTKWPINPRARSVFDEV
jgi:hypothetical protein